MKERRVKEMADYWKFDLQQKKTTTDDWIHAFADAIQKRVDGIQYIPFIGWR